MKTKRKSIPSLPKEERSTLLSNSSDHAALRKLSNSFRIGTAEQFANFAAAIAENSNIEIQEKIDALYEAIDEIHRVIVAILPRPPEAPLELWEQRKDKSEKNPFLFTERIYGSNVSTDYIHQHDLKLYKARLHWAKKYGAPKEAQIKSKSESIDELLDLLGDASDLEAISASVLLRIRPLLRFQRVVEVRKNRNRTT